MYVIKYLNNKADCYSEVETNSGNYYIYLFLFSPKN